MIIAPSLLSCNFLKLKEQIEILNTINHTWIHLDIMDGHFVPNLTFGNCIIEQVAKIAKIPLDAHIMCENPLFYLKYLEDKNIHNITLHIETLTDPLNTISQFKNVYPSVGITLRPNTDVSTITIDILKKIDLLLIMSVMPGFSGQGFIEESIDRVHYFQQLKVKHNLSYKIQVDGGINLETAKKVIDQGATNLVAGNFVFKNDIKNSIASLQNLFK